MIILIFQIVVFASIFLCCKINERVGNIVTIFWVIFTLVEVFMPWLMALQFYVIYLARKAASK